MSDRILIKNGYVLTMDPDTLDFDDADVLIVDGKIAEVRPNIIADNAEVIDARNMIVTPGLVDTHRHYWQTQLRTVATDWTLSQYFVNMRARFSAFYR
jgi:5-methylthioadenosine/S-adenosylhomocysteine deaminase